MEREVESQIAVITLLCLFTQVPIATEVRLHKWYSFTQVTPQWEKAMVVLSHVLCQSLTPWSIRVLHPGP